jgi:SsrA-binding protein
MKKPKHKPAAIENRRARFDYELRDELVAGLVLTGPEVRAVRDNRAHLKGAFATIREDELWLNNASLSVRLNAKGTSDIAVDTRPRKLLVHKKQLKELEAAKASGLTIVPVRMLNSGRFIKVVLATAKGKKQYDKRETIKRRDTDRETARQLKRG